MAYMSQEKKALIAPKVKAICKKYGMSASLGVRHHSTLVLNVKSGKLDVIGNWKRIAEANPGNFNYVPTDVKHLQVNHHHYKMNYDGKVKDFLGEVITAMMDGNHDRSDTMTDYFDVGWYIDINIGQWNKPYIFEG